MSKSARTFIPVLAALAVASPLIAQTRNEASAALSNPTEGKTAAASVAATVKPGVGGPGFGDSAPVQTDYGPPVGQSSPTGRVLNDHLRAIGVNVGPISTLPTAVNHLAGSLVMGDGKTVRFDLQSEQLFYAGGYHTMMFIRDSAGQWTDTMTFSIKPQGDQLAIVTYFSLADGRLIDGPAVVVPASGGSSSVALPDGGVVALELSGAHAATADEIAASQFSVDSLNQGAATRPSPTPPAAAKPTGG